MAKFVFCVPRYHTNFVPWVRILTSAGHEVAVHAITRGVTENYSLLRPTVLKESRLSAFLKRFRKDHGVNDHYAFPAFWDYWALMVRENPDVVIIRGVTRWFSRIALVISILQRRRVVIYDQEDPVPAARSTWVRRAVFGAVGIPHFTARLPVRPLVPSLGKAEPLPFGAPLGFAKADRGAGDTTPPKLLMVAKYRTRKGHRTLLQALARLAPEYAFSLTLCGEEAGPEDRAFVQCLSELAKSLGISERLRFENSVPNQRMGALYRAHDLFILPSRNEPAAVSSIEAAWNGCAILISRDSGTRGYAPPGPEFDFDPENVDDIVRALRSAFQSPYHLQDLRTRCHNYISKVADDGTILRVFESLLEGITTKVKKGAK